MQGKPGKLLVSIPIVRRRLGVGVRGRRWVHVQELATAIEFRLAVTIAEETVVTDALQPER
jgi:hypothetical protein